MDGNRAALELAAFSTNRGKLLLTRKQSATPIMEAYSKDQKAAIEGGGDADSMGRLVDRGKWQGAVAFLASDAASIISGADIKKWTAQSSREAYEFRLRRRNQGPSQNAGF